MTVNRIEHTAIAFDEFLKLRSLVYEPQIKADLLAAVLSSQFVLFAGPSGTGKSTAAKALAEFFCPPERRATILVESTWEAPYDVAGTYSSFAEYFLTKPGLDELFRLDSSSPFRTKNEGQVSPVAVIEEANLSRIEGYLSPVVHGLSVLAQETVEWVLHQESESVPRSRKDGAPCVVPPKLVLGPWPRFLGTINVDHTAIAPARKISGRACVVLLEPLEAPAAEEGVGAIWSTETPTTWQSGPAELLHDPRTALAGHLGGEDLSQLATALDDTTTALSEVIGLNPVSKRDEHRCLLYMAFFCDVARHMPGYEPPLPDLRTIAAENALLHYVLPGLTAYQFASAVDLFQDSELQSLLRSRCKRLRPEEARATLGYDADFWTALS